MDISLGESPAGFDRKEEVRTSAFTLLLGDYRQRLFGEASSTLPGSANRAGSTIGGNFRALLELAIAGARVAVQSDAVRAVQEAGFRFGKIVGKRCAESERVLRQLSVLRKHDHRFMKMVGCEVRLTLHGKRDAVEMLVQEVGRDFVYGLGYSDRDGEEESGVSEIGVQISSIVDFTITQ